MEIKKIENKIDFEVEAQERLCGSTGRYGCYYTTIDFVRGISTKHYTTQVNFAH